MTLPPDVVRKVESWIPSIADLTPAISLAYVQDEEVVTAGWGATADTLFQAASISKPVSAALALSLVADGELSLDDDIATWLRSWSIPPLASGDRERGRPVTLRRLLCHAAGFGVHGFPGYKRGERVPTLLDILDGRPPANTAPIRLEQPPGADAVYSGGGYIVLQQLIEDAEARAFSGLPCSARRRARTGDTPAAMPGIAASSSHPRTAGRPQRSWRIPTRAVR